MEFNRKAYPPTPDITNRTPLTEGPILMQPDGSFVKITQSSITPAVNSLHITRTSPLDKLPSENSAQSQNLHQISPRSLFGGALTFSLPNSFEDISKIREIPDHQEVFADSLTNLSIIVEVLDYERAIGDEYAARHFFNDLADFNNATDVVVEHDEVIRGDASFMPFISPEFPRCKLIGRQTIRKFSKDFSDSNTAPNHDQPADVVRVYMIVLRLLDVGTDLLITLNCPLDQGEAHTATTAAGSVTRAEEVINHAVNSFQIFNWALFG